MNETPTLLPEEGGAMPSARALAFGPAPSGLAGFATSIPIATGVFGIECEHHYGITTHEFREGQTVAETVYWLIRNAWHAPREDGFGLTDDNHTWEAAETKQPGWWSRIRIVKNRNSPAWAWNPLHMPDGAGATWFSQKYRVATRASILAEIASKLEWADKCRAVAERQRDTIRGRKERSNRLKWAEMAEREAELIASRWPAYSGVDRTEWQQRMHEHRVPASGIVTAEADETRSGSVERSEIEPGGEAETPQPFVSPNTPNPRRGEDHG